MKIYGLEKLSLVDYDGKVSATIFTGKCNFRCGFCHNSPLVVDFDSLPPLDEKEVFDYLKKRIGILEGVCITGGEPTLQTTLPSYCEKLKEIGYSVKLDTNGTNPEMVKSLHQNGLVDYFAMDIKNDKESYASIIGFDKFDTSKIEQTVEYFLTSDVNYEFRTTLINEFHAEDNMKKIGEWIKGAKAYFMQKFKDGENCISQGLTPVSEQTALKFKEIVSKYVKNVKLRGYDL